MADRFPSIEEFSAGDTSATLELDPTQSTADDFLSREKAALGDDADLFATEADSKILSGDDDLLGGGANSGAGASAEVQEFESAFPDINSNNQRVGPGGGVTDPHSFSSYQATAEEEEEPEVIKSWRANRDTQLADRREKSDRKKDETIKNAETAIDEFYNNYNNKRDKTVAASRKEAEEFLASREDTVSGGTSWERIAKLVDLSGKGARGGAGGSGKERFRELLLNLRKDEKAPGASGY